MGMAGTPATFGQRLIAVIIDGLIGLALFIPVIIVVLILGAISDVLGILAAIVGYLAVFAALIWIYVGGIGKTGQTPGKRLQGVQVVSNTGGPIGVGGAAIRWILSSILNSFCYIGGLWMLWDGEKKTLYDKILDNQAVSVQKGELLPLFPEGKPF